MHQAWAKSRFPRLIAASAVFVVLVLLKPFPGLAPAGQGVVAVVLTAIVLWATEALPIGVSALVVLVLLGIVRGLPPERLFAGFQSPILYFFIGVTVMGGAIVQCGLASRAARLFLRRAGGSPGRLYLQCLLSLPFLALVLPSAITRNAILLPAYQEVFRALGLSRQDNLGKAIVLTLGLLNPFASSAFLTGGLAPMTTATLLGGFTWWRWFFFMGVPYYALLVLGAFWVWRVNPSGRRNLECREAEAPGPFTLAEIRVFAVLVLTSLLWLTDFWHGLPPAVPALLAACLLAFPRVGVLAWRDVQEAVPWATFLVLGASLSLAEALLHTGAAAWFAALCVRLIGGFQGQPWLVVTFLVLMISTVHLGIANMSACIALLIPVTTNLAQELQMNPLVFGLIVGIAVDAVVLYPVQTATNLLAYETGLIRGGDVLKVGLGMLVLTTAAILLIAIPWWSFLGLPLAP